MTFEIQPKAHDIRVEPQNLYDILDIIIIIIF